MSDPLEEAYYKYFQPNQTEEQSGSIACPSCESVDVDRQRGYRGEYVCRTCGVMWIKK